MFVEGSRLEDLVKGFHIDETISGGQVFCFTENIQVTDSADVTKAYRLRKLLPTTKALTLRCLESFLIEEDKPLNPYMSVLLAETSAAFDNYHGSTQVDPSFHSTIFDQYLDDYMHKWFQYEHDFSPHFKIGYQNGSHLYLVCYTLHHEHYSILKRKLNQLGKTEEIKQLDQAFAAWIEMQGKIRETLGDGGRVVNTIAVQGSTKTTKHVRVVKTRQTGLAEEDKARSFVRFAFEKDGIPLNTAQSLGIVRTEEGKHARYDSQLPGITLDEALRTERYKSVALDYLPHVAEITARLHYALFLASLPHNGILEDFSVKESLRSRFGDGDSCYCKDNVNPRTRTIITSSNFLELLDHIDLSMTNLDSHPKQYLVVIEPKENSHKITQVGRVDFEPERFSAVPLTVEVANIYRYGDYCGPTFEQDFKGLDTYIDAMIAVQKSDPPADVVLELKAKCKLPYLLSVIYRGLCFYNAWFKPERRKHMLGRVPEVLANIRYAVREIETMFPDEYVRHEKDYNDLLRVLPRLERAAKPLWRRLF